MGLLNLGRDIIADRLIDGNTYDPFDNSNAEIGVGTDDTAFAASQTGLTSAVSKGMEATYPQRSANVLTFRSVFSTSEANQAWEEWGVNNGTQYLNRKVEDLGTKTSAVTRQLTVTLTIAHSA